MQKFRQFFQEKIVLSAVMCVLLAVVLTTATTAWYAVNHSTITHGIKLQTGGTGGIKVAVQEGGEDIMADETLPRNDKNIPIISIHLKDFQNIENGKIAPGAYGPMTFYITALSESIHSYAIKVQMEYRPSEIQASEEEKETHRKQIEAAMKDHFCVYETKYTDDAGIVRFQDPVTFYEAETDDVTAAKGALKYNEEVKAEIYWVWNYELTDIPGYENLEIYKQYPDLKQAVRAYDEQDTMLGNYIDDIWFNVYIEGSVESGVDRSIESNRDDGIEGNTEEGKESDIGNDAEDSAENGMDGNIGSNIEGAED